MHQILIHIGQADSREFVWFTRQVEAIILLFIVVLFMIIYLVYFTYDAIVTK